MARQIGSNAPALTDVTQQNYQIVSTNTLRNFQSASDALAAQADMNNADYQAKVTEWQNEERRKQAESQGGGGGVAATIGELGKQLVAGYAVVEEIKSRKAQAKAQAQKDQMEMELKLNAERRAEENLNLDKAKFEYSMASDQADREIRVDEIGYKREKESEAEQLDSVLTQSETILNQIETQAMDEMASLGKSAGVQKFKETVKSEIFNAEWYKALPEGSVEKIKIDNLISKRMLATVGENADALFEERKKLVQANTDLLTQNWLANNAGKLNEIKNGAGALTVEQVNASIKAMDENYEALFNDPDIQAMMKIDPSIAVRARIEQMKQYGVALEGYFGDSTKWTAETRRFQDAANGIAMLEIQEQKTGKDLTADKESLLKSLGIETDYKNFPTSLPNRLDAQNRQLEAQVQYRTLIKQDQVAKRVVGEQTPAGQKYNRYIIGQYVYDNMDNIDMAIQTLKQQQGVGLDDEYVSTQIALLERLPKDRDKYAGLVKKNIELTQKITQMTQPQQRVINAGSPMGTFGGLSPEPQIMELPGASQEEVDAFKLEIEHNKEEMVRLATEWNAYGINIAKPSDRSMLDNMRKETAATATKVSEMAGSAGVGVTQPARPSTSPEPAVSPQGSNPDKAKQVRNYVKYEFDANKKKAYQNIFDKYIKADFEGLSPHESVNRKMNLLDDFKAQGSLMIDKLLSGDESGADAIQKESIERLKFGNFDATTRERYNDAMTELYNEVKKKKWYYHNKLGQQSRSNAPPNFSSGNQGKYQEVKSALITQDNEGNLTPAVHLNGTLATWKYGYAPFKGGTVQLTSDFRSKERPNHHGIDLVSNDKRVATMQGGKVKWAGDWSGSGYGNIVFVETPEGQVEVFAHLDSINVKKGQPVAPGDVLGQMGNTGRSRGAHLHFEVWGHNNWSHPSESSRQVISPWDYLAKFKGKTTLPNPVGGTKQISTPQYGTRSRKISYHTGAVKIGENLSYFRGWVFNEKTGQMVKATPQQVEASKRGVPEVAYRTVNERYRITNGVGQTVAGTYEIPARAQQEGTFMFLTPAGYKDKAGNDVWELQGYYGNQRVFSKPVLNNPNADGDYKVTQTYNYSPLANPAHKKQITDFVKKHGKGKGITMYVRSVPKEALLEASPDSSYKDGALDLRGDLSLNKSDYSNFGSPEQDFGYSALKNDPKLRQAVYEASKSLGVPMVWITDQIAMESEWNPNVVNSYGYRGYFQVKNEGAYGITQAEMNNKYLQISKALVKYHKAIMGEVGGYRNFEEYLLGVWAGGNGVRGYRKKGAAFNISDANTDWYGYRKTVSKKSRRRYRWSGMSPRSHHYHDTVDGTCPVCYSMMRSGSFQAHYY